MPKALNTPVKIGLLIVVAEMLIDRFITPIPNLIAIPVLLLAIVLIIIGGWRKQPEQPSE